MVAELAYYTGTFQVLLYLSKEIEVEEVVTRMVIIELISKHFRLNQKSARESLT